MKTCMCVNFGVNDQHVRLYVNMRMCEQQRQRVSIKMCMCVYVLHVLHVCVCVCRVFVICIFVYGPMCIPVVPHKAVAEVSKITNLWERLVVVNHGWQSEATGPTGGWGLLSFSLSPTTYLPTDLSMYLSTYLPIYLSICLSIYLPIYLSLCLSVDRSIYLSIWQRQLKEKGINYVEEWPTTDSLKNLTSGQGNADGINGRLRIEKCIGAFDKPQSEPLKACMSAMASLLPQPSKFATRGNTWQFSTRLQMTTSYGLLWTISMAMERSMWTKRCSKNVNSNKLFDLIPGHPHTQKCGRKRRVERWHRDADDTRRSTESCFDHQSHHPFSDWNSSDWVQWILREVPRASQSLTASCVRQWRSRKYALQRHTHMEVEMVLWRQHTIPSIGLEIWILPF